MKKSHFALLGLLAVAVLIAALGHAIDPVAAKSAIATDLVMAGVVSVYGTGARNPSTLYAQAGVYAQAEMRALVSQIAVTNGDSIASIYRFGEIPADCIINPSSVLWYYAATGVTDFDIGLRYPNGGAVILADCIVNGQDIHTAGSTTLAAATGSGIATPANQIKRAWELAGLTSNPGGNLEVYATANAAASATGVVNLNLTYYKGA